MIKIAFTCLHCIVLMMSCSTLVDNRKNAELEVDNNDKILDPIAEIPQWLKLEVDKVLPLNSLNIWIPTGEIKTSSLIRVPRFPVFPSKERLDSAQFNRFRIELINDSTVYEVSGVRNEQISAQIAIAAKQYISALSVEVNDFVSSNGGIINRENIKIRYAKYVPVHRARSELIWTEKPEDVYGGGVSGYGAPDVVADPLVEMNNVDVPAFRAQPVWFTFDVPFDALPGNYQGSITISSENFQKREVSISIQVLDAGIPNPEDYNFFLDLWFNPNAIAVSSDLELWSEKHWELIEIYMEDLLSRGAKTITTTITHDPWQIEWMDGKTHSQTGIGYAPMIQWNLAPDSTWSYDYSIFDRYVELAMRVGISKRIDVFSLTPFKGKGKRYITYFDEREDQLLQKPYDQFDEKYKTHWKSFLRDFVIHLTKKGWLEKTYLSFDESPSEVIASVLETVRDSAPVFLDQFSIAGKPATSELAQSLSLFYEDLSSQIAGHEEVYEILNRRKEQGRATTYYLCGNPGHPNSFSFSPAIESRMIPWIAIEYDVDGYLRWAYNSWTNIDPMKKPIFNFIQGDDYYVYPGNGGPVSSIRWELLKDGIEDYELFHQLKSKSMDLDQIIEIATRNKDGREKGVDDFEIARDFLFNKVK